MSNILELTNVSKTFEVNGVPFQAVKSVSFAVGENEAVGLVGGSGCGKSTLAKLITRLDRPDNGSILLAGEEMTVLRQSQLKNSYKNVKMIFQEPRSSFDLRLTLGQSITIALRACGVPASECSDHVVSLMREVGLNEKYVNVRPRDVSGGECQRAAIARAIATRPKLLICDEATSALDVSIQAQIMELLVNLRKTHKMSFLFISHDLALVSSFCDRVLVMCEGEIVEEGKALEVLQHPGHEYTKKLLSSVLEV